MEKNADAFRTISEAADDLDLPQHVLRFWETRFSQIKPMKRAGGRRYYRSADLDLLRAVKKLLHVDGYTIKGVQRLLREKGGQALLIAAQGASKAAGASETAVLASIDSQTRTESSQPRLPLASILTPAPAPLALSYGAQSPVTFSDAIVGQIHALVAELAVCRQILHDACA